MADEMPGDPAADRGEMGFRFLDVVFSDRPDAGIDRFEDAVDGLALGGGHELDARRQGVDDGPRVFPDRHDFFLL